MLRLLVLSLLSATASAQVTTVEGRARGDWEQPEWLVWLGHGIGGHSTGLGGVVFVTALHDRHVGTLRYTRGAPIRFGFGGTDEEDYPRQNGSSEVAILYGRALSVTETAFLSTNVGIGMSEHATEIARQEYERSYSPGLALGMQAGVRLRYIGAFGHWHANVNRERTTAGLSIGFTVGLHN